MALPARRLAPVLWLVALALPAAAERLPLPTGRPVVIRADSVTADPEKEFTSFRGHFEVDGTDWPMQADTAIVYGPLEAPTRVLVTGRPARIWVKYRGVERALAAQADEIEYLRKPEVLYLRGNARMERGDRVTLEGDHFQYDVTGGQIVRSGRVRVWSVSPPTPAR